MPVLSGRKRNNGWLNFCFCGPVPHHIVGALSRILTQVHDELMLDSGAQRLSYGTVLGTTFFHVWPFYILFPFPNYALQDH